MFFNNFNKALKTIAILILFGFLFTNFVFAVLTPPDIPQDPKAPFKNYNDIQSFFDRMLTLFATIFWLFAIAASFYAGYLFLFSGGVEEKIGKAKKMIWYAIIAIVLGLMAYGLPALINNILKGGESTNNQNQQLRPTPPPSGVISV